MQGQMTYGYQWMGNKICYSPSKVHKGFSQLKGLASLTSKARAKQRVVSWEWGWVRVYVGGLSGGVSLTSWDDWLTRCGISVEIWIENI